MTTKESLALQPQSPKASLFLKGNPKIHSSRFRQPIHLPPATTLEYLKKVIPLMARDQTWTSTTGAARTQEFEESPSERPSSPGDRAAFC
ncbi:hypothetical protein O181_046981 [Austropuccinia psidii MF-1]|uniref:Uncharacterized protein n=1 Tax=Austropuccinia psidii MF-1 TaxID=1389203 RepID=A0A9Q3HJ44_9BASI|nr:hypothetical protein [Austropuccinia psidii MF-1]